MGDDYTDDPPTTGSVAWDARDSDRMLKALQAHDKNWRLPKRSLGLQPDDWKPDLVATGKSALHLHVAGSVGRHWTKRLEGAVSAGYHLTIAAPQSDWLVDADNLIQFAEFDARAVVLKQESKTSWSCREYRSIPLMIAAGNLRLEQAPRKRLGLRLLDKAKQATGSNEKGDRFEDMLALLFSQVSALGFHSCNRVNATEELDLVFGNHAVGWALPASPIVLVSAKNYGEPVGTDAVNDLAQKMANRFGQCSLGFLCVSDELSSKVAPHIQRMSQGDRVIVPLDGRRIRLLLESEDLDKALEDLVIDSITG
jgi:hypothetical protein